MAKYQNFYKKQFQNNHLERFWQDFFSLGMVYYGGKI